MISFCSAVTAKESVEIKKISEDVIRLSFTELKGSVTNLEHLKEKSKNIVMSHLDMVSGLDSVGEGISIDYDVTLINFDFYLNEYSEQVVNAIFQVKAKERKILIKKNQAKINEGAFLLKIREKQELESKEKLERAIAVKKGVNTLNVLNSDQNLIGSLIEVNGAEVGGFTFTGDKMSYSGFPVGRVATEFSQNVDTSKRYGNGGRYEAPKNCGPDNFYKKYPYHESAALGLTLPGFFNYADGEQNRYLAWIVAQLNYAERTYDLFTHKGKSYNFADYRLSANFELYENEINAGFNLLDKKHSRYNRENRAIFKAYKEAHKKNKAKFDTYKVFEPGTTTFKKEDGELIYPFGNMKKVTVDLNVNRPYTAAVYSDISDLFSFGNYLIVEIDGIKFYRAVVSFQYDIEGDTPDITRVDFHTLDVLPYLPGSEYNLKEQFSEEIENKLLYLQNDAVNIHHKARPKRYPRATDLPAWQRNIIHQLKRTYNQASSWDRYLGCGANLYRYSLILKELQSFQDRKTELLDKHFNKNLPIFGFNSSGNDIPAFPYHVVFDAEEMKVIIHYYKSVNIQDVKVYIGKR